MAVVARYTGTKGHRQAAGPPGRDVSDVRNGKIARFRQFADTAKFLEVVPAEVATIA